MEIDEQLKSQAPDEGLHYGQRGTIAIPSRIVGHLRSTDSILAKMCNLLEAEGTIHTYRLCLKKAHAPTRSPINRKITGTKVMDKHSVTRKK